MPLDTDTFAQLLAAIDRFVADRLRPLEEEVDRTDAMPDGIVQEMRDLGLFGLSIPEAYGGLGLTVAEETEVALRLGHAAPAFRSVFGTNNGIGSQGLIMDGTEAQKRRYLPVMATGELIGSFCLTEPDSGSDAASLKTRAVRAGDGYRLTGTKRFITNAPRAGIFTVMARTDPDQPGARGISAFLVEADRPGITLGQPYRKMGQKGTFVCDVIFDDVEVPADCLIGEVEGRGFATAMKVLDRGRLHIAALCVGIAERLIGEAMDFAIDRRQFGRPIADFQLVQAMLADSHVEAAAAQGLVRAVASRADLGETITRDAAAAKLTATEMVGRVADRAVQIHGGSGYIAEYAVERLYRDVRLFRLYEGTSQIQQLVIARAMIADRRASRYRL